jgi:DNA repair protein SbcC/Rad50
MRLNSIKLTNIRSYLSQKIDFPMGSLLLSGDIGSGKSTVLLAIEFALFGAKPSELPASSLLRQGKKQGSVELCFELGGKNITIKRNLKRGKNAIKQETGYIISDGSKKELSPVEMKSEIFDLLGYPKDLVAKGKDLIYRFTVYTPQEEMKRILMEDKDTRLNTLRKVFNIDKYKKIRENSAVYIRFLKEKSREFKGIISDLDLKRKEKSGVEGEIKDVSVKIEKILPILEKIKKEVSDKKENISVFEKRIDALNKLRNSFEICEVNLRNLLEEREKNKNYIEKLRSQIKQIQKELASYEIKKYERIGEKIRETESKIKNLNVDIDVVKQQLSEFIVSKSKAKELISKISNIEKCPLCLQNVGHEHKRSIEERETKHIFDAEKNIAAYSEKIRDLKHRLENLEKDKAEKVKMENKLELIKLTTKNLNEKKDDAENLEKMQEGIRNKIGVVNSKKIDINKKILEMKNIEDEYTRYVGELDLAVKKERRIDIEKTGYDAEKESLSRILKSLDKEIENKLIVKEKLTYLDELQNWVENYFVLLMGTMEKHVMMQVYREFNELFKSWFNVLIEDETITVRIDDEFTPVVDQNGYETNVENLSGGERTSVALSYRLALNKVINDIVASINTRDILMLDEPTDGFSSEQLDKLREVLDQLDMNQIIIVSHESKIESFVDKVIRVGKEEHISTVA